MSPADPDEQSLRQRFRPPVWKEGGTWKHPLGTDRLGRDMLSRIIWGSRVSLAAGVVTVLLASAFGAAVGLVAGYYGGRVDAALMRVTDATMSFPVILLALILAVTVGPSFTNVVVAIAVILWARYARVIRGQVLTLMELDFIAQARIAGAGGWRIITRHLFPNTLNTLVVLVTLQIGYVIIVEASLSFLGAGIPPPTPAWGSMIAEGRDFVTQRLVGVVLPRARHPARRARLQPARRLAARHPRPEAPPALIPARCARPRPRGARSPHPPRDPLGHDQGRGRRVVQRRRRARRSGWSASPAPGKSMTCLSLVRLVAAARRAHRRRLGAPRRRGAHDQERARDAADPRPEGRA